MKSTILADVALLADLHCMNQIVKQLINIDGVCALYATTGASNLRAKIMAEDIHEFRKIVNEKIASIRGLNVVWTNLITEVIKENGFEV